MMNVIYSVTEERYTLGNESRISYGIAAYANTEQSGTATIIASVHDITSDKEKLSKLVDNCNSLKLSSIHLYDVIDDFLSE